MASRKSGRLIEKRVTIPIEPPLRPAKRLKTAAEATKDWKTRLKMNDPVGWEEYTKRGREANKLNRQNASDEQKAKQREQSRLRMQAMRARKKAEKLNEEQPRMTRAAKEEQRLKWREAKAKWWAGLHPQKKRRVREQKAKRERDRRASIRVCPAAIVITNSPLATLSPSPQPSTISALPTASTSSSTLCMRIPAARRKAKERVKSVLPKSPRKRMQTIADLLRGMLPHERQLFEQHKTLSLEFAVGKSVLEELKRTNAQRSKKSLHARRVLLAACQKYAHLLAATSSLRVTKRSFAYLSASKTPKQRKKEAEIADFYQRVATPVPDKKSVSAKTGQSTSILSKPLKDVYEDFIATQEPGSPQVSFSHFAKCRPKHVRPRQDWRLRMCLCEYCTNVDLKLRALNCTAARINNAARVRHGYFAVDLITCGRHEGSWRKACAYRECAECQGKTLQQHTQQLFCHQASVTWMKWENQATEVDGKRSVRKMQVRKTGTMVELVQELEEEIVFLAAHLFRAHWQQTQFNAMRMAVPFPRTTVGMVLDFAENFTCLFQDEIQAAHWYHEQVTVHPIVTYYTCPLCEKTVSESLVFISDDRCHNFDAVHSFTQSAVEHLKNTRGIQLEHVVQWTDGCAAQYKSKGPFADISHALEDFSCTLERNFFGSRHGKGPSDGESAVVKHGASAAVVAGEATISSAKDLFDFCYQSKLNVQPGEGECMGHFFRSFFWVPKADIVRGRKRTVKTLKGTRSLHCVRCVEENVLCTRELSCFCNACQSSVGVCINIQVAGDWTREALRRDVQVPAVIASPVVTAVVALADVAPPPPEVAADVAPPPHEVPADVAPTVVPAVAAPVTLSPTVILPGGFVKVSMTAEGRQKKIQIFYAKVLKVEDNDIHVRFFVEKTAGLHVWADEAWVTADQIVQCVVPPELAPTRALAFIFE